MRNRILALTCALSFSAPLAALADTSPPEPFIQPISTVHGSETLSCHYYYHEGTIIRWRDCRTQREWDRLRRETERNVMEFQLRTMTTGNR